MSQPQLLFVFGSHGAVAYRVVIGTCRSSSLMPAFAKSDWISAISCPSATSPLAYESLKSSAAPCAMPAPHSDGPLPGRWQVLAPPGLTFQPWLVSRFVAEAVENG